MGAGTIIAAVLVLLAILFGVEKVNKNVVKNKLPGFISRWYDAAVNASKATGVPVEYILAVIWVESAGDPDAVGSANERGLMQLKPIAALDVEQALGYDTEGWEYDPYKNIQVGSRFLELMKKRGGTWDIAFEAYNQGLAGRERNQALAQQYRNKVIDKIEFMRS